MIAIDTGNLFALIDQWEAGGKTINSINQTKFS